MYVHCMYVVHMHAYACMYMYVYVLLANLRSSKVRSATFQLGDSLGNFRDTNSRPKICQLDPSTFVQDQDIIS